MQFLVHLLLISLQTSLSLMEISVALFLVVLASQKKIWKSAFKNWRFWIPLFVFALSYLVSALWGNAPWSEKLSDIARLRFFLWVFLLSAFLKNQSDLKKWLRTAFVVGVVVCVYSIFQHFFSFDWIRPEGKKVLLFADQTNKVGPLVVGFFNHHLTFSNVFLFYGCLWVALRKHLKGALPLGLLFFLLVFWTGSRTGWCALSLCLIALFAKRWWHALVGVGVLVIVFFAAYRVDPGVRARVQTTLGQSATERENLWRLQVELWKEKPVFGVGPNNNERHCREAFEKHFVLLRHSLCGHAHNMFLQVLATQGFIGLLAYGWLWLVLIAHSFVVARRSHSFESDLSRGLCVAFIGFQIQSLTQVNFFDAEVLINTLFFWAIASSLKPAR